MWKIEGASDNGFKVLRLSGRLEGDHLAELKAFLDAEAKGRPVVLDLGGVKLVDQEVVAFLADCEKAGTKLRNCPPYIREWMGRK